MDDENTILLDTEMSNPDLFVINNADTGKRKRCWFVQRSYKYDTEDSQGNKISSITHDEWKCDILDKWTRVYGLEYIAIKFHDKDIYTDGSQKPFHVHALLKYKESKTRRTVIRDFGLSSDNNCQIPRSPVDSARYLLHISESALNEEKHRYVDVDVMIDFDTNRNMPFSKLMVRREDKKTKSAELEKAVSDYCQKVRAGDMSIHSVGNEFREQFGELEWKKYKSYFENARVEYFEDRLKYYSSNPRRLRTIYISGGGGSGKSTLASALADLYADGAGVHRVAAKGKTTFDFAGNYQGEKVTVANEFVPAALHFRQFCDVFDIGEAPVVGSRNSDKPWFAEYAFLTNSDSLEKWINDELFFSGKEFQKQSDYNLFESEINARRLLNLADPVVINDLGQIRRRITSYIEIVEEYGWIGYDANGKVAFRTPMTNNNGFKLVRGTSKKFDDSLTVDRLKAGTKVFNDIVVLKKYHKGAIRVYGIIAEKRNLTLEQGSYKLLGSINFNNIRDEVISIAEQIKDLINNHDIFANDCEMVYETFEDADMSENDEIPFVTQTTMLNDEEDMPTNNKPLSVGVRYSKNDIQHSCEEEGK